MRDCGVAGGCVFRGQYLISANYRGVCCILLGLCLTLEWTTKMLLSVGMYVFTLFAEIWSILKGVWAKGSHRLVGC